MEFQSPDFYPVAAESFLALGAILMLLVSAFAKRAAGELAYVLTQALLLCTACVVFGAMLTYVDFGVMFGRDSWSLNSAGYSIGGFGFTFGQMFVNDPLAVVFKFGVCVLVSAGLLYGRAYLCARQLETPEYYVLVLFATLGMMVLISAGSLLTVYLGLEMLSLSSYALVAINRDSLSSTEAGMKYFVLGALASGLLLYGISMVYGATQTLNIVDVARALDEQQANNTIMLFGMVFVVAGLAFKLGAVPFHMWVPDVYQGAPTAVTLLISSAPKMAAVIMTVRLLALGFWPFFAQWQKMLIFLAIGSLLIGNLAAIAQSNLKRMLAYSGISHMGFMLLGLACARANTEVTNNAYAASLFYVVTYAFTAVASFGLLLLLSRQGFEGDRLEDLKGLNQRNSWWAAMLAIVMFSMAGIPFFVGFFAKFLILQYVWDAGYVYLAVFAVIMSLIGAFYYLRIVKLMYFDEPTDTTAIVAPRGVAIVLSLNVLLLAVFGLWPNKPMYFFNVLMHAYL